MGMYVSNTLSYGFIVESEDLDGMTSRFKTYEDFFDYINSCSGVELEFNGDLEWDTHGLPVVVRVFNAALWWDMGYPTDVAKCITELESKVTPENKESLLELRKDLGLEDSPLGWFVSTTRG